MARYGLDGNRQFTPVAGGRNTARSRTLFQNLVDTAATVDVLDAAIRARFNCRARLPLLLNAGRADQGAPVLRPDNRPPRLEFL